MQNTVLKVIDETEHYELIVGLDAEGFNIYHIRNKEHDVCEFSHPCLHIAQANLKPFEEVTYGERQVVAEQHPTISIDDLLEEIPIPEGQKTN